MNGSHVATDRVTVAEQQQEELVDWTTFAIEGVLLPVLAIFGILGKHARSPQKSLWEIVTGLISHFRHWGIIDQD